MVVVVCWQRLTVATQGLAPVQPSNLVAPDATGVDMEVGGWP